MRAISILLVLVAAAAVAAQERFVRPVDEAKQDRSFVEFRSKLIAAAERKDTKYILGILDPDIKSSFGGHSGIEDFKEFWDFSNSETRFWDEFLPVIRNGGHWFRENGRRTMFTAPYSFDGFPDDLDAFEHSVVFGERVNLRMEPSLDAAVLLQLSYNVVSIVESRMVPGSEDEVDWYRVKTLGGKAGWIKAEYVRSPIDYRAGFEKKGGQWTMTFFIAGD
jgi:hypothetical protein